MATAVELQSSRRVPGRLGLRLRPRQGDAGHQDRPPDSGREYVADVVDTAADGLGADRTLTLNHRLAEIRYLARRCQRIAAGWTIADLQSTLHRSLHQPHQPHAGPAVVETSDRGAIGQFDQERECRLDPVPAVHRPVAADGGSMASALVYWPDAS